MWSARLRLPILFILIYLSHIQAVGAVLLVEGGMARAACARRENAHMARALLPRPRRCNDEPVARVCKRASAIHLMRRKIFLHVSTSTFP